MTPLALGPSRREFVTALLGAPLALAACQSGTEALPPGELLLPGKTLGHRLRSEAGGHVAVPSERWERAHVVIVGAGAAGLAAAWWLERHGVHDVIVLELDPEAAGGTSRWAATNVTPFPWGAHYIVAPQASQTALVALLAELGALEADAANGEPLVAEHAACRELEERVFYRGRWYEGLYLRAGASAQDLAELARFQQEIDRWVAFRDAAGRRAFALPSAAASDDGRVVELDRLSFAAWLDALGLRSPRLRWLADYACRDDYGLSAEDTSAWAGVAYFASRMRNPGDDPQSVVTWPEGNGRLIAHMSRHLGARLRLGHAVANVAERDGHVELTALTADGPRGFRADRAIVAAPQFVSERIVAPLRAGVRALAARDRGAWAVANLYLRGRPQLRSSDAPLAWDNVLYDSKSLGYVVATHQLGKDHGPTVLTWYYPFTGDAASARRQLDSARREDWAAAALADIGRAHPDLAALCERIDIAYWAHGMVRPRPGSVFAPALAGARAPLGAIYFAGSELSGMSLFEEAFDHGVRAAAEVLGAREQHT